MKSILIALVLLIPLVYAQDALEARKASLDLNANDFILQMTAVISYSSNKSIDANDLTSIKTNFETKLAEALKTTTLGELKAKEKEMKDISKQFKDKTKEKFRESIGDVKIVLFKTKQNNKDKFKDKENRLNQERKKLVNAAYDKRISEINTKIELDKSAGKTSKIQSLLLERFQRSKLKLNETNFIKTRIDFGSGEEILGKATEIVGDTWSFLSDKIKLMSEPK